jgi:hypothetical protein
VQSTDPRSSARAWRGPLPEQPNQAGPIRPQGRHQVTDTFRAPTEAIDNANCVLPLS